MYFRETKQVPIKKFHIGDKFDNIRVNGGSHMCSMELIALNNISFTVRIFDKYDETYSTEGAYVEVELTDAELKAKYSLEIEELIKNLQTEYTGKYCMHDMDNAWITYSIPELVCYLKDANRTVLGYFKLPEEQQKYYGFGDIGLVFYDAEYDETFRTHGSLKSIQDSIEEVRSL